MIIKKEDVLKENLDFFDFAMATDPYLKSQREHYKLLTYIGKQFNNVTIIDAGTYKGFSCLSLAQNKTNNVITYDINDNNISFFNDYKNIKSKILDINEESDKIINSAKLIFLDIDPHDGVQEKVFIERLKKIKFNGIVICDDINLNEGMKNWWNSVEFEKYDLTDIGHHSGTGLINFNKTKVQIL